MASAKIQENIAVLDAERHQWTRSWLAALRRDQAQRLRETRALFSDPVVIVDPHTHSDYSDGCATVAINRAAADEAGIDFIFATDHASLGQKRAVRNSPTMSWGQEPDGHPHHIGLLCNTRLLKQWGDRLDLDVARARKLAPFVWIPHPTGWYLGKPYSDACIEALWTLAPAFAMEVLNGACRIGTAFCPRDAAAVAWWDRLLADGIRVTPLGASDAHLPESIGSCWTALPGVKPTAAAIIKGLNAGHCLASEGPLLALWVEDQPMGASVQTHPGRKLHVRYRVADAAGLQCLRLVADGRAVKTIYPRDATCVTGEMSFAPGKKHSIRLEVRAVDNRRAFSAPVYFMATNK